MDLKKVYVIYDPSELSKEVIMESLRDSLYDSAYKICTDILEYDIRKGYIADSDEVWLFGKVDSINDYVLAQSMGKDIWRMG